MFVLARRVVLHICWVTHIDPIKYKPHIWLATCWNTYVQCWANIGPGLTQHNVLNGWQYVGT